jgi:hypothetical protein
MLTFPRVLEPGAFGFNTTKRTATLYDGGDIPFSTTKLSTIGDAIVGILRNPDATRNKYVFVRSALTTHAQLLANLEKATACKWKVEHDSVSRVRQQGQDRMAKGDFMGNLDLIRAAILTPGTGFDFASMNDILGLSGDQYVDSLVSEYLANLAPS